MKKVNESIEYVVWIDKEKRHGSKEIHAVGFIIEENKNSITISLTKSYGEYIDIQKVNKCDIILREKYAEPSNKLI